MFRSFLHSLSLHCTQHILHTPLQRPDSPPPFKVKSLFFSETVISSNRWQLLPHFKSFRFGKQRTYSFRHTFSLHCILHISPNTRFTSRFQSQITVFLGNCDLLNDEIKTSFNFFQTTKASTSQKTHHRHRKHFIALIFKATIKLRSSDISNVTGASHQSTPLKNFEDVSRLAGILNSFLPSWCNSRQIPRPGSLGLKRAVKCSTWHNRLNPQLKISVQFFNNFWSVSSPRNPRVKTWSYQKFINLTTTSGVSSFNARFSPSFWNIWRYTQHLVISANSRCFTKRLQSRPLNWFWNIFESRHHFQEVLKTANIIIMLSRKTSTEWSSAIFVGVDCEIEPTISNFRFGNTNRTKNIVFLLL